MKNETRTWEERKGRSVIENIVGAIRILCGRKLPQAVIDEINAHGEYEGFWGRYDEFGTSIVRRGSDNEIKAFYDLDGKRTCRGYDLLAAARI